jgi:hypothetical protein
MTNSDLHCFLTCFHIEKVNYRFMSYYTFTSPKRIIFLQKRRHFNEEAIIKVSAMIANISVGAGEQTSGIESLR